MPQVGCQCQYPRLVWKKNPPDAVLQSRTNPLCLVIQSFIPLIPVNPNLGVQCHHGNWADKTPSVSALMVLTLVGEPDTAV